MYSTFTCLLPFEAGDLICSIFYKSGHVSAVSRTRCLVRNEGTTFFLSVLRLESVKSSSDLLTTLRKRSGSDKQALHFSHA